MRLIFGAFISVFFLPNGYAIAQIPEFRPSDAMLFRSQDIPTTIGACYLPNSIRRSYNLGLWNDIRGFMTRNEMDVSEFERNAPSLAEANAPDQNDCRKLTRYLEITQERLNDRVQFNINDREQSNILE